MGRSRLYLCPCGGAGQDPTPLAVHQDPQVLFSAASPQPPRPQPVLDSLLISSQVQDLVLIFFVKLHTVLASPRPVFKTVLPSDTSTSPPRLVSSAKLTRALSIPPSRSFMKRLNRSIRSCFQCREILRLSFYSEAEETILHQSQEVHGADPPGSHFQGHKRWESAWEQPEWVCQRQ